MTIFVIGLTIIYILIGIGVAVWSFMFVETVRKANFESKEEHRSYFDNI